MNRRIQRILVANRGEIAVRVIRACRELGISCVALASEADRFSLHAQLADEVVEIGPAESSQSYLVQEKVIAAAVDTHCDAVHPGYGFLAENAGFARACAEAGLIFIGPTPEVIEEMGLKTRARARMQEAGVPVVPGALLTGEEGAATWARAAKEVGYPILVKASAGGGGKGMREVHAKQDLADAIAASQREAVSAFGNGEVFKIIGNSFLFQNGFDNREIAGCHFYVPDGLRMKIGIGEQLPVERFLHVKKVQGHRFSSKTHFFRHLHPIHCI